VNGKVLGSQDTFYMVFFTGCHRISRHKALSWSSVFDLYQASTKIL